MKRSLISWGSILLCIFFGSWYFIRNFYDQQVLSQHETYLTQKIELLTHLVTKEQSMDQVSAVYAKNTDDRITRMDKDGLILYDTFATDDHLHPRSQRPEVKAVMQGNPLGRAVRVSETLHKELLYIAIPVKINGNLVEILRIAEPTEDFLPKSRQMRDAIFIVYTVFWSILTGIIFQILRRRNRPIETILPVLKQIIEDPDHPELILHSSPQWQELYQRINQLSEQMSSTHKAYSTTEHQLHVLLNELTIGIFILDKEKNLLSMNGSMQNQLGIDSFLGNQAFTKTITDTKLIQLIYQATPKEPLVHEEVYLTNERILDITIRSFADSEQMVGISYDLTHIRQLEKLQQDFVGNISHELKTPVTSFIGFTETLLDGAKEDPETLTQFLEIMQKDAYRLQNLILEIIQHSKSAGMDYPIRNLNVHASLQQLIETYQPVCDQRNISVKLNGPSTFQLATKSELFLPIIKNLFENALNYSPNNQTILIDFSVSDHLVLRIEDYGIGIAEEEHDRIFERFYRVDKARDRNSGGTGLGLAIVKEYVELLQGSITVSSHPGVGSIFTVTLPIKELN